MDQDESAALLELERRRCAAISAGDIEALKALLSEDYVHVHMNGALDDRAGHLVGVAKRPRTTTRGELHVRIYGKGKGELAVLTGELTNQMAEPGQEPQVMRAYCHQVAVRQGQTWQFVSIQLAPLRTS